MLAKIVVGCRYWQICEEGSFERARLKKELKDALPQPRNYRDKIELLVLVDPLHFPICVAALRLSGQLLETLYLRQSDVRVNGLFAYEVLYFSYDPSWFLENGCVPLTPGGRLAEKVLSCAMSHRADVRDIDIGILDNTHPDHEEWVSHRHGDLSQLMEYPEGLSSRGTLRELTIGAQVAFETEILTPLVMSIDTVVLVEAMLHWDLLKIKRPEGFTKNGRDEAFGCEESAYC